MGDYREVGVPDFLRFMKEYLDRKIDARSYQRGIFDLMKQRGTFTDEEFRILQMALADADDYDPIVKLEYTILEPELRRRVANSIEELIALGSDAVKVDIEEEAS
jgi:hypothetical protein